MAVIVRTVTAQDADGIAEFFQVVDSETKFMLFEPGERKNTAAIWGQRIAEMHADGRSEAFVAQDAANGDIIAGLVIAQGEAIARIKHTVDLVVAVRKAYAGQGIATRLFAVMEEWARGRGLHRLHLEVASNNERAIALYKRLGFEIEGYHRHAVRLGDEWVDDYTMAKLLE